MTYQDTLHWMFAQLPMYQKQGKTAFKKDLSNTIALAKYLKHPEHQFKSIHVAGTNGKGSTSHMLASVLQEAGYKVGLYTSPHLKDFRERIKINGTEVSEYYVMDFIKRNKSFLEAQRLSFFEMTVGMAFDYFAKQEVDIAIIEVGLGGRLDSTNIITPEISVITNIGLDHTQFLGNTLSAIASEKGGIIKPNIPVVVGETQKETTPVFNALAKQNNTTIVYADQEVTEAYSSDLIGSYQSKNSRTVVKTLEVLQSKGFNISKENLKKGLLQVVQHTKLLGRWQVLQETPKVICDTAHNKEGLTYTMQQLLQEPYNKLHIVFGVVSDKDLESIFSVLPKNAMYYFCKANIPRAMEAITLQQEFQNKGFTGKICLSVEGAYRSALASADENDVIYIGGSTFVVAEVV